MVRGGSTNIGVGGCRASHIGGEIDFFCPAAKVVFAADGTHLHGVGGLGIKIAKGIGTVVEVGSGNVDKVVHVVVHADLPGFGIAILGPAQINVASLGLLIVECGRNGTGDGTDGVEHGAIAHVAGFREERGFTLGEGKRALAIIVATIPNELIIITAQIERTIERRCTICTG